MSSKKVKVRLLTRIAHIGKENEVVEVSHTYAMNALIPQRKAILVTPEDEQKLIEESRSKERNARYVIEERQKIHEVLHGQTITFVLRGSGDTVFGGVSENEILKKIEEVFGFTLEKKHILLPEGKHLKKAGNHDVKIHLGHELYTRVSVSISVGATK